MMVAYIYKTYENGEGSPQQPLHSMSFFKHFKSSQALSFVS
jgi:hypothetical protein